MNCSRPSVAFRTSGSGPRSAHVQPVTLMTGQLCQAVGQTRSGRCRLLSDTLLPAARIREGTLLGEDSVHLPFPEGLCNPGKVSFRFCFALSEIK